MNSMITRVSLLSSPRCLPYLAPKTRCRPAFPEALLETVSRLSQQVARSLERKDLRGRTVKLKLRLSDFTTFTRQKTVPLPVQSSDDLANAASDLLRAELHSDRTFRLAGVGVSGFDFEEPNSDEPRQLRLEF